MASWASYAITELQKGNVTKVKPHGNSMLPLVLSGATVTLKPVVEDELIPGKIVLVKVKGTIYLHLIKTVQGKRYQIGNNKGGISGWVSINSIFGIAIKIENP